jgi:hypothetical protein
MPSSFKVLRIISIALKIFALLVVALMGVALSTVLVITEPEFDLSKKIQFSLNILFSGSLLGLVLYAVSDMIRVLLEIHSKLTGSSS